jgi:hypothetical protein
VRRSKLTVRFRIQNSEVRPSGITPIVVASRHTPIDDAVDFAIRSGVRDRRNVETGIGFPFSAEARSQGRRHEASTVPKCGRPSAHCRTGMARASFCEPQTTACVQDVSDEYLRGILTGANMLRELGAEVS